jgi:serine-type D-Ala-D-Ala carboxypeptidase/endopeptidase (penicillin-binding protein 4)
MGPTTPPSRTPFVLALAGIALPLSLLAVPATLADAPGGSLDAAPPPPALAEVSEGDAGADEASQLSNIHLQLSRILSTGAARSGTWGVLAISLEQGDTLFALNADASLAPASNQKLITSAAALYHMGPDFRFPTFLLTDGTVENGVLEGDLILYGTGDPALSDRLLGSGREPFREFARTLRARGIHTVNGDVLGDGTFFTGSPRHASWNHRNLNDWFAAPVSALSYNENMVTLRVMAAAPGHAPRVQVQPEGGHVPLINQARTVAGGARAPLMMVRDDPDQPIELRGEMVQRQADVWRRMTVSDPATFTAGIFRSVMEEEGIRVSGRVGAVSSSDGSPVTGRTLVAPAFQGEHDAPATSEVRTLAVHHSPPMSQLLEVLNKESHNLYGEVIFFALGRIAHGEASFEGGSRAVTDYLVRVVGFEPEGLQVEDGSGLSRFNRTTAGSLIRLLDHMHRSEHADVFWASLPEAGNPRELRRMYRSPAAGNLRAKTGTINRVSALSGVVTSSRGEPILFSIMANDVPSSWAAKRVEDDIGIQLASLSRSWQRSPDPVAPPAIPSIPGEAGSARADDQQDGR